MSKRLKKKVLILTTVVVIVVAIIASYFIIKYIINKNKINNIYKIYSEENIQNKLDSTNTTNISSLMQKINGEDVVGIIKIDKINFEGLVYEGTSLDTLSKGVGHFENSPYLNGNVCLAAHNYRSYWAKLNTLEVGDTITYVSFLGTKSYYVNKVLQIDETDWSNLENTNENILTLITCVYQNPTQRLCVQAVEIL